tara:strand:- start:2 stop:655 length:654 start_codon:yes stop_codon:yes gene_type:complete
MAINPTEAILGRLGAGPSYASLQSPNNTISQAVSETPNLGVGPFSNLTDSLTSGINSASKSVSNFFTAPDVAAVPNTLGKIGSVASFFTPAGFALSGIAGLAEFNDLNDSLSTYGVPEDQQLGIMDALYAALPGPTLQGQYTNALNQFNEDMMENVRADMFNAAFADTSVPSRGDFAGFPGNPAEGSDGGSSDGGSSGSSGGGMSDGTSDGDPSGPI